MSLPIDSTPDLSGEDARNFIARFKRSREISGSDGPDPNLHILEENARKRTAERIHALSERVKKGMSAMSREADAMKTD